MKIVLDNFNTFQITGVASRSAPLNPQSCIFSCLMKDHHFVFWEYASELRIFVLDRNELSPARNRVPACAVCLHSPPR